MTVTEPNVALWKFPAPVWVMLVSLSNEVPTAVTDPKERGMRSGPWPPLRRDVPAMDTGRPPCCGLGHRHTQDELDSVVGIPGLYDDDDVVASGNRERVPGYRSDVVGQGVAKGGEPRALVAEACFARMPVLRQDAQRSQCVTRRRPR
jgi:hypothetical protein